MEFIDVVNEQGLPTGQVVSRDQAHEKDILHRTAHIWVCDPSREYVRVLLQKRSLNKESYPGCYDTSSAGHIKAGDQPLESALRELEEKLGIHARPEDLQFIGNFRAHYEEVFQGKTFRDNEVIFVYLYEKPVEAKELQLQEEELDSVKWFGLDHVYLAAAAEHDPLFCVPTGGIDLVRRHYYRHCTNDKVLEAEEKINSLLQAIDPACRIFFLRTAAKILDSYKVKTKEMRHQICKLIQDCGVTDRTYENLSAEWELHNLAYQAHVGRAHARDVDLDYEKDPNFPVRWGSDLLDRLDIE